MAALKLHPDRLFPAGTGTRNVARRLYSTIERLPIVSPHGHTDPRWFADDEPWSDASALFNEWHHAVIRRYRTRFVTWKEAGRSAMAEIGAQHDLALMPQAADLIYASMPTWPAHPDAKPVLTKLKSRCKLAIVTNMDTDLFRSKRLPIDFDGAVTAEMAGVYKPHPGVFEYALKTFPCSRS